MEDNEEGDVGDEISDASDTGERTVDEVPDTADVGESSEEVVGRTFVDKEGGCLDETVDEEYGNVPVLAFGTDTLL